MRQRSPGDDERNAVFRKTFKLAKFEHGQPIYLMQIVILRNSLGWTRHTLIPEKTLDISVDGQGK
jgi:hypothetical protein